VSPGVLMLTASRSQSFVIPLFFHISFGTSIFEHQFLNFAWSFVVALWLSICFPVAFSSSPIDETQVFEHQFGEHKQMQEADSVGDRAVGPI
jgi:hypothetical protein